MSATGLHVTTRELEIVREILGRLVPGREVRAFGSRVTGRHRRLSDLDLAVMGEAGLSLVALADLREAFIESDLPFRVDVLDWSRTDARFRRLIETDSLVIQSGAADA